MAGIPAFHSNFLFWFYSRVYTEISQTNLFSFSYDYNALARMVASQLYRQIILLLKRLLTHFWSCPLMPVDIMENEWKLLSRLLFEIR